MSKKMFDYLENDTPITSPLKQLKEDERNFIKRLINPSDNERDSLEHPNGQAVAGPFTNKTFLYEIVANKRNGIDVDRWDYIARDCYQLDITSTFDHKRLLQSARVIEVGVDRITHICFREKTERCIYNMFYTRHALYRNAYMHKVSHAVDIMMSDAMKKINTDLKFEGKEREMAMSECVEDMEAFSQISDHVYHQILHGKPKDTFREAAEIICRIERRDLYRCICESDPQKCSNKIDEDKISKDILTKLNVTKDVFQISVNVVAHTLKQCKAWV
ncbi:Deoxynucleoside triphosphate triphosphohydrolase SAMHD1 [Lamellibrachia satsuma]|nr:Deoxynucleoside triphosphate triphosphohydrolase SAMHD1 [Lamellibrachia satsuma]